MSSDQVGPRRRRRPLLMVLLVIPLLVASAALQAARAGLTAYGARRAASDHEPVPETQHLVGWGLMTLGALVVVAGVILVVGNYVVYRGTLAAELDKERGDRLSKAIRKELWVNPGDIEAAVSLAETLRRNVRIVVLLVGLTLIVVGFAASAGSPTWAGIAVGWVVLTAVLGGGLVLDARRARIWLAARGITR